MKIYVSTACYDDIGQILNQLNIKYQPFTQQYNSDLIFLNCGTSDYVEPKKLKQFVKNGGILYASDHTSSVINQAFPKIFNFGGNTGTSGTITATIEDQELISIIGTQIDIYFNMGVWSVLNSINTGQVILCSNQTGKPIMVKVPYGKGKIYYTCFHNNAQANEKENILLELLVLKQISDLKSSSISQISKDLKIDLNVYKDKFSTNSPSPSIQPKVTPNTVNPPLVSTKKAKATDIFNKWNDTPKKVEKEVKNDKPNPKNILDKF